MYYDDSYFQWPLSLLIFSVSLLICTANGSDSNDVVGLLHTMEENCDGKDACVNENIDRLINSLSKVKTVDRGRQTFLLTQNTLNCMQSI